MSLSILADIKSLLKVGTISVDNWVFKLHYKLTVVILVVFAIVVNSRQYFGDPIDCTFPKGSEIENIVDTYCWFNSYNLVDIHTGDILTQVRKGKQCNAEDEIECYDPRKYKKVKQTYYQWIGIVLLLQAGLFYIPRFLWKSIFEEGRIKELVSGLTGHVQDKADFDRRKEMISEYVDNNENHHRFYAMKFTLCEILNFFNVIGQIFLTDWFLGNAFLKYGPEWLWYDADDTKYAFAHPSHRYFPKETQCTIHWGSAGGNLPNRAQSLCVLPIHIFNEKIYLFLWFYFIALAGISGLHLIYRIIVIFVPQVRYYMFVRRCWGTDKDILRRIIPKLDIGDWFILYQIMKNMDPIIFGKLMEAIDNKFAEKSSRVKMNPGQVFPSQTLPFINEDDENEKPIRFDNKMNLP